MDILAWTDCVRSSAGKISYIDIFSSSNLQDVDVKYFILIEKSHIHGLNFFNFVINILLKPINSP